MESYFALRTFTVEKDEQGLPQNLSQPQAAVSARRPGSGYWSDGLYTAPSDDALLIFDIASIKKLGYNMLRKHCKNRAPALVLSL